MSEEMNLQDVVKAALNVKPDDNAADQEEETTTPEDVKESLLSAMKSLSENISWDSDTDKPERIAVKANVLTLLLQAYEKLLGQEEYSKKLDEIIEKDTEVIRQIDESKERQKKSRWLDNLLMAIAIASCILAIIFWKFH